MFITKELLLERHACNEQVEKFNTFFPDGVELTEEVCLKYCHEFNVVWCAWALLSDENNSKFCALIRPSHEKFLIDTEPAFMVYKRDMGNLRLEFLKYGANADAHDDKLQKEINIRTTYNNAIIPFVREFAEAKARAFYSLLD